MAKKQKHGDKQFETNCVRTPTEKEHNRSHSTPIYMTSSFRFDSAEQGRAMFAEEIDGNIYSRFSNPNTSEFIEKMCVLEGADDGFAYGSGMAAIFSGMAALVSSGDHILASRALFGSSYQILTKILPRWGIDFSFADLDDPSSFEKGIRKNTKMLFVETPSNPGLDIIDLEWLGTLAKKNHVTLFVDNTFATPYIQRPIELGADLVMHSATKFIDGQGRAGGGIIVGKTDLMKEIRFFSRQTGPSLSPFNAWIFSKSLETLSVRLEKHCENAFQLAEKLEGHRDLESVKYPFLPSYKQYELAKKQMKLGGGLITIVVKGGFDRAKKFLDCMNLATISANLGDSRTIVTHPSSTTHSKLTEEERQQVGILPGLLRISVGLEHIDDITSEILQSLDQSA
ncbi:MAG: aminotransferase class V-fold PLP-dependent enzyme [Spirochaetia bacterium]|nr:aminotransferase class V-fold PLP-dependent enzyme [Spirochaetia bacterium]